MLKHHIDRRLRARIGGCLSEKEWSKRVLFWEAVLEGFNESWRRDRSGHERDSDRLELRRRQRFRRIASPEAVPVPCYGRESRYLLIADEIINLRPLDISRAMVAAAKTGVSSARPRFTHTSRQVLRIRAHIQGRRSVAPNFPRCF